MPRAPGGRHSARDGILDRRGRPTSGGPGEVGVLASSTRSRTRSLGLVGLAIVGSGLLVNAYLAIIARNISAAEYAYFGAFWSLALVAGFGVFLPIEQETARLMQVPDRPRGLLRAALLTALSLAAVQVVLVAAAAPWLARAFGGHGVSVVAFAVLCLISAGQFVVRGALIGMDRMDRYALVMVLDTLLPGRSSPPPSPCWSTTPAARRSPGRWSPPSGWRTPPSCTCSPPAACAWATVPAMGTHTVTVREVRRAVAPLLLGSLCAQLLLNGPPVLIPALASNEAEITRAGQFIAAFTLARVPLFLVVPLQTALLPILTGLLHSGDRAALRRVMLHITIGLAGLGVAALAAGLLRRPAAGRPDLRRLVRPRRPRRRPARRRRRRLHRARPRHAGARRRGAAPARGVELAVGGRGGDRHPVHRPGPPARGRAGVPRRLGDGLAGRDTAGPDHRTTRARAAACLTPCQDQGTDDLAIALTYYSPYVSGLTNMARDIAEGLAARGRTVTVVTSHFDSGLPLEEEINGVRVLRAPVLARVGRGVISPQLVALGRRTLGRARVASLQLPMLEAGAIAAGLRTPLVSTYHCDVTLPPGLVNDVQRVVVDASNRLAMRRSVAVAVTSEDYARHSRMWPSIEPSMHVVAPPCPAPPPGRPNYRETDGPHIGFLGRIVREKGLEHLVRAFRALPDPDARLLIGGDYSHVAGGSVISQVRAAMGDDDAHPAAGLRARGAHRRLLRLAGRVHAAVGERLRGVRDRAGRRHARRRAGAEQRHPGRAPARRADRFRHPGAARGRARRSPARCRSCTRTRRTGPAASPARTARSRCRTCSTRTRCCSTRPRRPGGDEPGPDGSGRGRTGPYDAAYYRANRQAGDRPALRWYARLVRRYCTPDPGAPGPYLDFGCGTGHLLRRLAAHGPAAGFEVSPWAADAARTTAPGAAVYERLDDLPTGVFGAARRRARAGAPRRRRRRGRAGRLAAGARPGRPRPGGHARPGRPRASAVGYAVGRVRRPDARQPQAARALAGAAGAHGFTVLREGSDGLWNVPYGAVPRPGDAVRAAPAFVQYLAGRLVLPPGVGRVGGVRRRALREVSAPGTTRRASESPTGP